MKRVISLPTPFISAKKLACLLIILSLPTASFSKQETKNHIEKPTKIAKKQTIDDLCRRISKKLSSINMQECSSLDLQESGKVSTTGQQIAYRDYPAMAGKKPLGRILFVGGIHGDEYSAVSVTFKWMHILKEFHSGTFEWRFIPLLNPDGLLRRKSQRMNERNVDLNRNFPTNDWSEALIDYWEKRTHKNKRRYPGPYALSEPESLMLYEEIQSYKPDVVISVHAPHGIVDFDGPKKTAPQKLGDLNLKLLGTYPGSLGNYANLFGGMPVVTLELKHAGIMPSKRQISLIWTDMVKWLRTKMDWPKPEEAESAQSANPAPHKESAISRRFLFSSIGVS